MRSEEELEERIGWLFPVAVERDEVDGFLLGLGLYSLHHREVETFFRLHEVVNWLLAFPESERETRMLQLAGLLQATDRVLAALLIEALAQSHSHGNWYIIPDLAYFNVARTQGELGQYICRRGAFATPLWLSSVNPTIRFEQITQYFSSLPDGYTKRGTRLLLLSLLDRNSEDRLLGLQLCYQLAEYDGPLRASVRQRLVIALQSGELWKGQLGVHEHELAASMIRTIGQWHVSEARPFLEEMARNGEWNDPTLVRISSALRRTLSQLSVPAALAS